MTHNHRISVRTAALAALLTAFAAVAGDEGALPYLPNRISETRDGRPFAREGFGVIRNSYQSGRLSARVSAIQGLFEVNYIATQWNGWQKFFTAEENAVYTRNVVPQVLIDDKPYRLSFENTVHYPFGYRSECTIRDVRFRHELVLDRNVLFRRVTVLANPKGRKVRGRLQQAGGWAQRSAGDRVQVERPHWTPGEQVLRASASFRIRKAAHGGEDRLKPERSNDRVDVEIGSSSAKRILFPINDRTPNPAYFTNTDGYQQLRFFLDEAEPSNESVWYLAFNRAPDEDLSSARIDRVYADFAAARANDARVSSGNALADAAFTGALDQLDYWEVDRTGGFRASPTYWVWGWDAMVHAATYAMCGRKAEIARMIDFTRRTADPLKGIAFSYDTKFAWHDEPPKLDRETILAGLKALEGARSRYGWQMFFVCLVNDYYQMTGDEKTMREALPWCRRIIASNRMATPAGRFFAPDQGYYPDKPLSVYHQTNDFALINCAVHYQGMRAWNELTGECADEMGPMTQAFEELFWDKEEGYWSDCWNTDGACHRKYYPSYGPICISRFALDLARGREREIAAYMRSHFKLGDYIAMFAPGTDGYLADGNQYGAYVPVACRYYWNMMNRAGVLEALDEFDGTVARHWSAITFPEGQTADVMNPDPAVYCDDTGNKQFFCAKAWLTDAIELHSGLQVSRDGLRLHAIANGRPYRISNLTLRGKRVDLAISGRGDRATYTLNGRPVEGDFIPWSALADRNEIVASVSGAERASPSGAQDLSGEAQGLFDRWMAAFMKLQVDETGEKELDGGFLCPACEWMHGRTPDAVWPLCWAWNRTGERKYLDAAVKLMRWGRRNMERANGAWINDPNAQWRGTTVFGQTALGRALLAYGAKLPADVRADWTDCFRRMTDYCYGWLGDPKTQVNVNYRAASPLAFEFAYRLLGDEKYRRSGDGQMAIVAEYIARDGLFFGEAAPSQKVSARGFRGVDLGYNAEESLPAMLEWADLRGDRKMMRRFLDSAKAHLAFLLPDGGLDNSFGSRAYKWTYWGSRTSDGMLPMLAYLAKDGVKGAARAAELQLDLYRRCTGANGLLTGGLHYPESGEPACVHHTFCHLKTLPQFIEAKLPAEPEGALASERPFGLRKYRTNGVSICRVGPWRATFSENDLYFWDDRGKATGGGSLTLLWNAAVGPVCAASMSEWYLQENGSMQQQKLDDVTRCHTPRLESEDGRLMSVHDNAVAHAVSENADGSVVSAANGVLADAEGVRPRDGTAFALDWTVAADGVRARATAARNARLVVPVIAGAKDRVTVAGRTATVERNGRKIVLAANREFTLERTARPDGRSFSPQTGFLAAYLTVPVHPDQSTEVVLTVE